MTRARPNNFVSFRYPKTLLSCNGYDWVSATLLKHPALCRSPEDIVPLSATLSTAGAEALDLFQPAELEQPWCLLSRLVCFPQPLHVQKGVSGSDLWR